MNIEQALLALIILLKIRLYRLLNLDLRALLLGSRDLYEHVPKERRKVWNWVYSHFPSCGM